MSDIEWSAEYSVGIAKIDEQHQELFEMINQLQILLERGWARERVQDLFDRFVDKVQAHFAEEENYMDLFKYYAKDSHKKRHEALLEQAKEIQGKITEGTLNLTPEISEFLEEWLTHHVDGPDRALGLFLQENGLV